ncbi:hypothetical protein [Chryseobacterium taihuense]|uniref:Uncharacterized protein n=1 Tax=Chryseobacterium taihuense TaxID=1141221 RepID=A0ABY0QZ88_9FLAO|nr:hypothetical protein [Chryseobacterium taihuense]SDM14750.1 hypothetical protein SAMN05216273_114101 [Chryseobacterium taihuense]
MIRSILKQWLFINYCGQKIGQFKGADLKETLLNITTGNIAIIIYGIFLNIYILLGFKNIFIYLIIAVFFEFIFLRKWIKKKIMPITSIEELNKKYINTPRWKRILFLILSIIIILGSYFIFGLILSSIRFFK